MVAEKKAPLPNVKQPLPARSSRGESLGMGGGGAAGVAASLHMPGEGAKKIINIGKAGPSKGAW